jgi:hypothetical protein
MKKLLIATCAMLCLSIISHAQTGIYMTYDDFKNGTLLKADKEGIKIQAAKHLMTMNIYGNAKRFDCYTVFGLLIDGRLYRCPKGAPAAMACELVMVTDHYALWHYTEITQYYESAPDRTTATDYVSSGLDGELVMVGAGTNVEKLAAHDGYEQLVDCIKSGKKQTLLMAINKCMAKDPTRKKDPKEAIPAVK